MQRVIISVAVITLALTGRLIESRHLIYDEPHAKYSPISIKEEIKPKEVGGMFAKIPQDFSANHEKRRTLIARLLKMHSHSSLGTGCSNQIARIMFPLKNFYRDFNDTETWGDVNFVNLPLIRQPFKDYRILVATAPAHIQLKGDKETPFVVYVVFSEDRTTDGGYLNIPSVYFVNKHNANIHINESQKVDPVLIIDNNRTVTGLKSKHVEKFVKFKSKQIRNLV